MSKTLENTNLQSLSKEMSFVIIGFVIFINIFSKGLSLSYNTLKFFGISMLITLVLINLYSKFNDRRRGVYLRDLKILGFFLILPFPVLYILNLDTLTL